MRHSKATPSQASAATGSRVTLGGGNLIGVSTVEDAVMTMNTKTLEIKIQRARFSGVQIAHDRDTGRSVGVMSGMSAEELQKALDAVGITARQVHTLLGRWRHDLLLRGGEGRRLWRTVTCRGISLRSTCPRTKSGTWRRSSGCRRCRDRWRAATYDTRIRTIRSHSTDRRLAFAHPIEGLKTGGISAAEGLLHPAPHSQPVPELPH